MVTVLLANHVGRDQSYPIVDAGVQLNGARLFRARDRLREVIVGENKVDSAFADMILDNGDVVCDAEPVRLAVLSRHVTNVNSSGSGSDEASSNSLHEQIGENAGVEATGTQHDQVGL